MPAPAFSWGDGGAQMTPEAIAAQRKVAEALMAEGRDYSPILSPWQGAARVAQAMMGGLDSRMADQAEKTNRAADQETIAKLLGGGASPGVPLSLAPPSAPSNTVATDAAQPRGIRNNNPLNIEAGPFTQGQPGFAGSDGRFAKFDTPEGGVGAANKLLDVYQNKHGLNTVAGIVGRWAPAGDGNNVSAYAENVARQLGIGPNDPIPPEMRPKLIAAMGQHENGRPIQVAALGNGMPAPDSAMPAGVPAVPAPTQVAQPAPAASGGLQGVNPALIHALTSPYSGDGVKKVAGLLLQQQMDNKVTYQTTPNGDILAMDPHGRAAPKVVYSAAIKPTFGQVGEDATGGKQYGFIDPMKRSVEPYKAPGSDQPVVINDANGKPLTVPQGQDPKKFREHVTTATADAMSGKLTEAQTNATQFANRMEDAERNVGPVEGQGTEPWNKAADMAGGWSSYLRSTEGQKYAQAKSQFITAQLRKESGAAISKSEFDRYDREFFPQPGDSKEVVDQKRAARKVSIEAMKKGAGPMYKSPDGAAAPTEKSIGGKTYFQKDGQWFEK